jgi:hypothetical protein
VVCNIFHWEFLEGCYAAVSLCALLDHLSGVKLVIAEFGEDKKKHLFVFSRSGAAGFKVNRVGEFLFEPPAFSESCTVCNAHFLHHGSYVCGHSVLVSRQAGLAYTCLSVTHAVIPYLAFDSSYYVKISTSPSTISTLFRK